MQRSHYNQKMIPTIEYKQKEFSDKGIEIIELNSLYSRIPSLAHDPAKPHRVDFYLLIYITKGQGKHFIDFNHYPFKDGSFIFVNKDQIHAFDTENSPSGKVIAFNQRFVDEISSKLRMPIFSLDYLLNAYCPIFQANNELKQSCDLLLTEIKKETTRENTDSFIVELIFSSMLLKLMRERPKNYHKSINENQIKIIHEFLGLIETHSVLNRNVAFYADKLAMSYKQLNQLCKLISKKTAKQLIDSYIIIQAKRKLAIDQSSVKEVSYDLGFEEISNFIKFFKKHSLETPAQFKKTNHS